MEQGGTRGAATLGGLGAARAGAAAHGGSAAMWSRDGLGAEELRVLADDWLHRRHEWGHVVSPLLVCVFQYFICCFSV